MASWRAIDHRSRTLGSQRPAPGPWCGEVRRLVPGHEIETLLILEGPRRSDRRASHAGRPQGLGARPIVEGPSGPAVRRDGRDDRAGGRPGRDAGSGAHGLDAGPGAQVGALRGRAGLPRAPRPVAPPRAATSGSGSASSTAVHSARRKPRGRSSRPSRSSPSPRRAAAGSPIGRCGARGPASSPPIGLRRAMALSRAGVPGDLSRRQSRQATGSKE